MPIDSKELIRAGRLFEVRKQLIEEVKSSPVDVSKRTLLFQVLAFCGEWDKAERHLDAIAAQDCAAETGVQVYKNLIRAEKARIDVFKRDRRPSFLTEIPSYLEVYFTAWDKLAGQEIEEAGKIYDQIEASLPPRTGTIALSDGIDARTFSGLKNMDAFLPLFLEVIVHDRYIWIPFESLKELSIAPPKTLFDLLWITARLTTSEGLGIGCYLPVLYHDSFLHEDERVKLGRVTDWIPMGGPFYRGRGQHVFQVGEEEIAILEIRNIVFDSLVKETEEPEEPEGTKEAEGTKETKETADE